MPAGQPPDPPPVLKGYLGYMTNRLGVPPWGQILVLALLAVFGLSYRWVNKLDLQLQSHDTKLQLLPLQISRELLAQAQTDVKLGRLDKAARVTDTAIAIIAKSSVEKIAAPQDYFKETLSALDSIETASTSPSQPLADSIHDARLMLAGYRSALEPAPAVRAERKTFENSQDIASLTAKLESGRTVIDFRFTDNSQEMFSVQGIPPFRRTFSNTNFIIENPVIEAHGATQTLDGIHWKNVVFVGARIKYLGGDLDLQYVRFVNCTFEVVRNPRGNQLIEFAALAENTLKVG